VMARELKITTCSWHLIGFIRIANDHCEIIFIDTHYPEIISCAFNSFGSPIKSMVQRRKSQAGTAESAASGSGPAGAAEEPSGIGTTPGRSILDDDRERCLLEIVDPGKRSMTEVAGVIGALVNGEGT